MTAPADLLRALDARAPRHAQAWDLRLSRDDCADLVEVADPAQLLSDALDRASDEDVAELRIALGNLMAETSAMADVLFARAVRRIVMRSLAVDIARDLAEYRERTKADAIDQANAARAGSWA